MPKDETNTLIKEPKIMICNSYSNDEKHMYFEQETKDIHQCQTCGNNMCYQCVIQDNGNDICFSCWKVKCVSGNMGNSGVHNKTIQQMI